MPDMDFEPGIAIFVGDAGKMVYDLFCSSGLQERIPLPLRDCIGLVCSKEGEQGVVYSCRRDGETEKEISELKDAVAYTRNRVSLGIETAKSSGYRIEDEGAITTIYIVGSPEARSLADNLRDTNIWNNDEERISSLFLYEPEKKHTISSPEEWALWACRRRITFCYFYGDVSQSAYETWGKSTFAYAAAEALFALMVAGLSTHRRFNELVPPQPANVYQHGTLSTCLVSVPYKEIREACCAKVSALLLDDWLEHIGGRIEDRGLQTEIMEEVEKPLADIKKRVIFQIAQSKIAQEKLTASNRNLSMKESNHIDWADTVREAHRKWLKESEDEGFTTRSNTLESAWLQSQETVCGELKNLITSQLSAHGPAWTIVYCEQLQAKLGELHKEMEQEPLAGNTQMEEGVRVITDARVKDDPEEADGGKAREEELRNQINEQLYMTPSFYPLIAVAPVAALTLALPLWLLFSAFVGQRL